MNKIEIGAVTIRLPFRFFGIKYYRNIGFKFNTFAYAVMCELFTPAIDFHQIDEMNKLNPSEVLKKLIVGGAHSYSFGKKCYVTEKQVEYWLTKLSAKERDSFMDKINVTILNGNIVGKSMTDLINKSKKDTKKKSVGMTY